jgi:hypothetical protein
LPQSAMTYSVDPSVTSATVQPGSPVKLRIPRNKLRFIAKLPSGRNLYESYEGTWYFPDEFFKRPERKKRGTPQRGESAPGEQKTQDS